MIAPFPRFSSAFYLVCVWWAGCCDAASPPRCGILPCWVPPKVGGFAFPLVLGRGSLVLAAVSRSLRARPVAAARLPSVTHASGACLSRPLAFPFLSQISLPVRPSSFPLHLTCSPTHQLSCFCFLSSISRMSVGFSFEPDLYLSAPSMLCVAFCVLNHPAVLILACGPAHAPGVRVCSDEALLPHRGSQGAPPAVPGTGLRSPR